MKKVKGNANRRKQNFFRVINRTLKQQETEKSTNEKSTK